MHPTCRASVRQTAGLLRTLGHDVSDDDPGYPLWLTPVMISYWFTGPATDAVSGPGLRALEPRTRRHVRAGHALLRMRPPTPADRKRLRAVLEPFFERHDVLLMPSLARPCPTAVRRGERSWLGSVALSLMFAPMTGPWNMAGFPAMSVPVPAAKVPGSGQHATGQQGAGLPGAVQLVAAPGGEELLLGVAAQLERARGWARHAPAYAPDGGEGGESAGGVAGKESAGRVAGKRKEPGSGS